MSDAILKFNFSLADSLIENGYITFKEPEAEKQVEQNLSGKKIVITGSLKLYKNRIELKNKIEAHGGQVIGSVSKNTDILISNDVNSTSSKCVTAKKLEIPILTEEDFNKLYFDFIEKNWYTINVINIKEKKYLNKLDEIAERIINLEKIASMDLKNESMVASVISEIIKDLSIEDLELLDDIIQKRIKKSIWRQKIFLI